MDVALVARSSPDLDAVAHAAMSLGVKATAYPVDLAALDQVGEQMAAIAADFGPIDGLINNAGMGYTRTLRDTPLSDWQQVLNLNLTSIFLCTQALLPQMRAQRRGTIVNVVSIAGKQTFPEWGAYSVSKFGLMAFSKTLAAEERAAGIRVVTLCPGSINTPFWDTSTVQADFDRTAMLTPEVVATTILYTLQLPTEAVVEELVLMPSCGTF
jgi:short-subunit dehydrogenase